MHGPELSRSEIVALLTHETHQLLGLGVDRDRAVIEVAKRHRVSPLVVLRLTAGHDVEPIHVERLSPLAFGLASEMYWDGSAS